MSAYAGNTRRRYTELAGHLVNLDVAPGFAAIAQVTPADPTGALTGASYPASLIRPDKGGLQPRLGVSWRPSLSSSLVVQGGYGIYRNLGVYQSIGLLLAQQPPFSTTFSIHNSLETPLTLANPFPSALPGTTNTFAIDPDFRAGYAHNWQVSVQRDSAGLADGDRGVPRREGQPPDAGVSAEHVPDRRRESVSGLSVGIRVHHVERQLASQRGAVHAAAAAARGAHGGRAVHAREVDGRRRDVRQQSRVGVGALDCAGLAQSRRRARPVVVRPAAPVVRAVSVHDRDRRLRGGTLVDGRWAHALQGLDGDQPAHHRQRPAVDADFLSRRQRHGRRRHPAGADRASRPRRRRPGRTRTPRPTRRPRSGRGAMPAATRFAGPRSSRSTCRSRACSVWAVAGISNGA